MATLQIIMVAIVYGELLFLTGLLIYACVDMIKEDVKSHNYELTGFIIFSFAFMVLTLIVIGLLPIPH